MKRKRENKNKKIVEKMKVTGNENKIKMKDIEEI